MVWDASKSPGDLITSSDWNDMVTDQKGHSSRHESGGSDEILHDELSGYVANEHIDHSTVTISAGTHLTGGGELTASRTLNVNETGIDATKLDGSAGSAGQFLQTDGSNLTFSNPTDVDATSYKGNDIDSDGDGTVDKADDADTLQGNQPSDLGNTIDNKSIVENPNGDIETNLGALPSKDRGKVVHFNQNTSVGQIIDLNLNSNEVGILLGGNFHGNFTDPSIIVDGTSIPVSKTKYPNSSFNFNCSIPSIVFSDSLYMSMGGNENVDFAVSFHYVVKTL